MTMNLSQFTDTAPPSKVEAIPALAPTVRSKTHRSFLLYSACA